MIKIRHYLKEHTIIDEKYWFLQIKLPEVKPIISYYQNQIPSDCLYMGEDNNLGYELDYHITVLYGILPLPIDDENYSVFTKCQFMLKNLKPFEIKLSDITKFNNKPEYDVIKIDVESDRLCQIHNHCVANLKNEETYGDYKLHVTIAYIKPNSVDYLLNQSINKSIIINELTLTSPEKVDYVIKLN